MIRWIFWLLFFPLWLPFWALRSLRDALFPPTVLALKLQGAVSDTALSGPFGGKTSLFGALAALQLAENDPHLRRVIVAVDGAEIGLGHAEELRSALERVRSAGKRVIVLAKQLNLGSYWLALGASDVHLSPTGSLDVVGIQSEFVMLKGLLDKVGVRARMASRGKYKSMREVFTESAISDANREMLEALADDLYQQLVTRIARSRNLAEDVVKELIDRGPFLAKDAHALGLVDEAAYERDFVDELKKEKPFRTTGTSAYVSRKRRRFLPLRPPAVAVLELAGAIRDGNDAFGPKGKRASGSRSFLKAARRIEKDPSIRAVVLRVNSPGGSALASDEMWHALSRATKDRPLVVSMGNVAASGGYYVSGIQGARIFANSTAITGSIGVVGGKFEASGLYEKLGVTHETIRRGKHASYFSPSSDLSDDELAKMDRDIDAVYRDFVSKMAEGRGISEERLDEVAQGRVWTGAQASERGLVDELGGFRDALDAVRKALGLATGAPLRLLLTDRPSALQRLRLTLSNASAALGPDEHAEARGLLARLSPVMQTFAWLEDSEHERVWLRMPFDLRFY